MADSLNGILIGGLLGSNVGTLIVAQFNLGWWGVEVVEPPTPPSRPLPSGGDPGGEEKKPKVINIWVKLGTKTYQRSYRVTEKRATQIVKVINRTNKLKKAVSVRISKLTKKD